VTQTHFGFQAVDEGEKADRVAGVFSSVAPQYDLMNDLMSGGLHRLWKAFAVTLAGVRAGDRVLDVAGAAQGRKRLAAQAEREAECGGCDAERDHVGQGIQLAPHRRRVVPPARDAPVEHVEEQGQKHEDRRGVHPPPLATGEEAHGLEEGGHPAEAGQIQVRAITPSTVLVWKG